MRVIVLAALVCACAAPKPAPVEYLDAEEFAKQTSWRQRVDRTRPTTDDIDVRLVDDAASVEAMDSGPELATDDSVRSEPIDPQYAAIYPPRIAPKPVSHNDEGRPTSGRHVLPPKSSRRAKPRSSDPPRVVQGIVAGALVGAAWSAVAGAFMRGCGLLITETAAVELAEYLLSKAAAGPPAYRVLVADIGHTLEELQLSDERTRRLYKRQIATRDQLSSEIGDFMAERYGQDRSFVSTRWDRAALYAGLNGDLPWSQRDYIDSIRVRTNSASLRLRLIDSYKRDHRDGDGLLRQGYEMLIGHQRAMLLRDMEIMRDITVERYAKYLPSQQRAALANWRLNPLDTIYHVTLQLAEQFPGRVIEGMPDLLRALEYLDSVVPGDDELGKLMYAEFGGMLH